MRLRRALKAIMPYTKRLAKHVVREVGLLAFLSLVRKTCANP